MTDNAAVENVHIHDWESGSWGVLLGVSKCRVCGKVAVRSDFSVLKNRDGEYGE